VRWGSARTVSRADYNAVRAAKELNPLLKNQNYRIKAEQAKSIINSENGVESACNAIDKVLNDGK
jgi:UDP:flavonoid glycosyltransferase YjiC (YdhE family)